MIENPKSYDINDLLNTLELSYKNNHLLELEVIKLIKI